MWFVHKLKRIKGHTFLSRILRSESVVIDLGANRGEFAREIDKEYKCRVYLIEANPHLVVLLPSTERIQSFNYAISDSNRLVRFFISDNLESSSTNSETLNNASGREIRVPGTTLQSFVTAQNIAHIDLLKVDIEGAEKELFESLQPSDLDRISQITVEFHDFTGALTPTAVETIVDKLQSNGFRAIRFSHSNMDWLFYRPQKCGVSVLSHFWLRLVRRNISLLLRNTLFRGRHGVEVA